MSSNYITINPSQTNIVPYGENKTIYNAITEIVKNKWDSLMQLFQKPLTLEQKITLIDKQMIKQQQNYLKLRQELENDSAKIDALTTLLQYLEKNKSALEKIMDLSEELANDKKNICLHVNLESPTHRPHFMPLEVAKPIDSLQRQINGYTGETFIVDNFPSELSNPKKLETDQAKILLIKLQSMCDQLIRFEHQEYLREINQAYEQVEKAMRNTPPMTTPHYLELPDSGYHLRTRLKFELDKNLTFLKDRVSASFKNKLKEYESLASAADKARAIHLSKKAKIQKVFNEMNEIEQNLRSLMDAKTQLISAAPA